MIDPRRLESAINAKTVYVKKIDPRRYNALVMKGYKVIYV